MMIKMNSISDLNDFFNGREILVLKGHDWAGHVVKFIEMVNKDESIPNGADKPNEDLLMKVKTKYGTDLCLEGKYAFIIEKKMTQHPGQN